MPDPRTERLRQPDPWPGTPAATPEATVPIEASSGLEILKPESYGIYGRILLASQAPEDQVADYLNPDKTSSDWSPVILNTGTRDYSPITHQLSSLERDHAWKDADRAAALKDWKTKFTKFATTTKDGHKKNVIEAVLEPGKSAADLTEDDTEALYNKFCKEKSNSTEFVDSIVKSITEGDTVSAEKLATLIPHIEWLASKFFGSETAKVVGRMVELEAQMRNDGDKAFNALLIDESTKRVDKLNDSEKEMLGKVYKSFEGVTVGNGPTAIPEADAAEPTGGEPGPAPLPEGATESEDEDDDDDVLAAPLPVGTFDGPEEEKYEHDSDVEMALENPINQYQEALDDLDAAQTPEERESAQKRADEASEMIIKLTRNEDAFKDYDQKMSNFIAKLSTEPGLDERFDQDRESLFKDRPDIKEVYDAFIESEDYLYSLAEYNPDALSSIPDPVPADTDKDTTGTRDDVLPGTGSGAAATPDWWRQGFQRRSELATEETEPEEEPTISIAGQTQEERKGQLSAALDASHGQQSVSFSFAPELIEDRLRQLVGDDLTDTGELSVTDDGSIRLSGVTVKPGLPFMKPNVVDITFARDANNTNQMKVETSGNAGKIKDALSDLPTYVAKDFQSLTEPTNPTWKVAGVDVNKGKLIVRYASARPLSAPDAESVSDLDQPAVLQEAPRETPPEEDTTI